MSEENVNTVRGMYEAFGRGDIGAVLAALGEKVEWLEAENFIYNGKVVKFQQYTDTAQFLRAVTS